MNVRTSFLCPWHISTLVYNIKPYLKRTKEQQQGTDKQKKKVKQQVGLLEIDKINRLFTRFDWLTAFQSLCVLDDRPSVIFSIPGYAAVSK